MALTFPTSASMMDTSSPSSPTPTPTSSSRTQSQLFVGSTASTTQGGGGGGNNGSGWFGSGGSSTSAYFQTVIISLVALAVLLIISVAFLYYRRRRLRLYSAADWPFQDRTPHLFFPGGGVGPGGTGGRGGKESKELGEKPEMWQVVLDTEEDRVGGVVPPTSKFTARSVVSASEDRERREDERDRAGLLERWLPLAVTSTTTTQASVPASDLPGGTSGEGGPSSSRPTGMFGRGFSSTGRSTLTAHHNAHDSLVPPYGTEVTSTSVGKLDDENGPPSSLPIHLTFIIAMPTDPSTVPPPPPVRTYDGFDDDDDEEGRDIPNVELGTTVVNLDLTDGSTDPSTSSSGSSSYPPPAPTRPLPGDSGTQGTLTPSRHTSLGQVLGLTSAEPGPTALVGGGTSTGYSLRDTLGLPRPVQRARRERRRDREAGMIRI